MSLPVQYELHDELHAMYIARDQGADPLSIKALTGGNRRISEGLVEPLPGLQSIHLKQARVNYKAALVPSC